MLTDEISAELTQSATLTALHPYLEPDADIRLTDGLVSSPFVKDTKGLHANAYYFGKWAGPWLKFVHKSPLLRERWHATAGTWDDKVVVDVGCGPGNVHVNLGDKPRVLIGVDVSAGTLRVAEQHGYTPLLADAHKMPLRSGIADVVALNATIHHCDDMEAVIAESARLVKSDGILIADHDPQRSAYDFKGPGKWIWDLRMPIYRLMKRGGHRAEDDEQEWAAATEIHHRPGDGITEEMFRNILQPMGFDVSIYPHNHTVGKEIVSGHRGKADWKMRLAQLTSRINPDRTEGALSLLVVAKRKV